MEVKILERYFLYGAPVNKEIYEKRPEDFDVSQVLAEKNVQLRMALIRRMGEHFIKNLDANLIDSFSRSANIPTMRFSNLISKHSEIGSGVLKAIWSYAENHTTQEVGEHFPLYLTTVNLTYELYQLTKPLINLGTDKILKMVCPSTNQSHWIYRDPGASSAEKEYYKLIGGQVDLIYES